MNDHIKYLLDYKNGKIKLGLGINCYLDNYLVFKRSQLNIILGHDNVGKTYVMFWYFLNLALRHKLKICIYSGENHTASIYRDLITMTSGKTIKELTETQIVNYYNYLNEYFEFIDNKKLYKPLDLLELFEKSRCNVGFIDPFTALDREMNYEANYKFLNKAREFCNRTGITIYISTHPTSESGRMGNLYPKGHEWEGHIKPPLKSDVEGGKAFLNRCDDMIVIHRLVKSETMRYYTMINVEKVKDIDTGGKQTNLNEPVLANYNFGRGFIINNIDPLLELRKNIKFNEQTTIKTS